MADSFNKFYYSLIVNFLDSGRADLALPKTKEWLALEPNSLSALRLQAIAYYQLDDHKKAEEILNKILSEDPNFSDSQYRLALVHYSQGKSFSAKKLLLHYLESNPENKGALLLLGFIENHSHHPKNAKMYAEKVLQLYPESVDAYYILALSTSFSSTKSALERIRLFKKALELDPERDDIHYRLGLAYLHHYFNYNEAEKHFRIALKINPNNESYQNDLFITLSKQEAFYKLLDSPNTVLRNFIFHNKLALKYKNIFIQIVLCVPMLFLILLALISFILWNIIFGLPLFFYSQIRIAQMRKRTQGSYRRKNKFSYLQQFRKLPFHRRIFIIIFFISLLLRILRLIL